MEDSEMLQKAIYGNIEYYNELVKEYKAGEYDEYKDNPEYAEDMALLEELSNDDSKIVELATQEVMETEEARLFVGSRDHDSWKKIIESAFAAVG